MALKATQLGATVNGGRLIRYTEQSAANAQLVSTLTAPGANWRLVSASVAYSAAPTQAGASIKTTCGDGSAFDTVIRSGAANAQYTNYPDESGGDDRGLIYGKDDGLTVTAPAGGAAITAAITIYIEVL